MNIRFWLVTAWLLAVAGCSSTNSRVLTRLNGMAALSGDLPADPLQWQTVTSGVDPSTATMFTLFGNEAAVRHARSSATLSYPVGSVLALATWQQQEDSRWFGGKIPAQAVSVEFLKVRTSAHGEPSNLYRLYEGSPLRKTTIRQSQADRRTASILSLRAAVMP